MGDPEHLSVEHFVWHLSSAATRTAAYIISYFTFDLLTSSFLSILYFIELLLCNFKHFLSYCFVMLYLFLLGFYFPFHEFGYCDKESAQRLSINKVYISPLNMNISNLRALHNITSVLSHVALCIFSKISMIQSSLLIHKYSNHKIYAQCSYCIKSSRCVKWLEDNTLCLQSMKYR